MAKWRRATAAAAVAGGATGLLWTHPAAGDQRVITVTLATGQQITVTVDVPAGTPVDQAQLPPVTTPVIGVAEGTPTAKAPQNAKGHDPAPAHKQTGRHRRKHRRHRAKTLEAVPTLVRHHARPSDRRHARSGFAADGTPTVENPTFSYAVPGPAAPGVPNFFIDRFRIPPFLLPIYQAAGTAYGVRWEILAAINEIETDYGRNLNASTAGAIGWMQFLPSTWKRYGVDANRDHHRDPYNPADAIFATARYLKAAGADKDLRGALFAYNHAAWYVDSVLMRARLIGGAPVDLIGSLTGLTDGLFPVHGTARYAGRAGETAINVFARPGRPAVAVQDGRIVALGTSRKLGHFVRLRDVYGNTYTYAGLKRTARAHVVLREHRRASRTALRAHPAPADPAPTAPATAGVQRATPAPAPVKERLRAHPRPAGAPHGLGNYLAVPASLRGDRVRVVPLRRGSSVIAGTILGRLGVTHRGIASHVRFQIRPAGRGTPLIDPKPILDGWKLLESTSVYRAAGRNPFGADGEDASIGQILLLGKQALQRRVLEDPDIDIYACGRDDIRAGNVDRRVLATLAYLSAGGVKPTVSALRCGHSRMTSSGNVSEHSTGDAVDISRINGIPIAGHQGPGSITDIAIRRLLELQGTMKPHQIISLMTFAGTDNTLALPDHADHIHVGFRDGAGPAESVLEPGQWTKLVERLGRIENPALRAQDE